METITEGPFNFKDFEKIVFQEACRAGREAIRRKLEGYDHSLLLGRESGAYETVAIRKTTIKTIMGEVEFGRRYYKKRTGGYAFLLDEALGFDGACGLISENLAELIAIECTEKPFRKAAATIDSLTGQSISAMGAWNVLQHYGRAVNEKEARLKELEEAGSVCNIDNVSAPVLFTEMDDIHISMQHENRNKRDEETEGERRRRGTKALHVGTAYTGWEQQGDGGYRTVNKVAYAAMGSVPGFLSGFEALLSQVYDMDGVERRLMNGDGEPWIRTAAELTDSILQLDPYHRSQAVIRSSSDRKARNRLFDAIKEKDVQKVLDTICDLIAETDDESARGKLVKLHGYFESNSDSLLTYRERGIELPESPEGTEYRNMGVQESNNCLITQRMKHRKASWSDRGADHMAKVLTIRNTVGLDAMLGPLPEPSSAERWAEPLSAAKAPKHDGKGYGADWLRAEMPFEQARKTNGREAIRGMLKLRPLSELAFL